MKIRRRADIILARICGWVKIFEADRTRDNIIRAKICISVKISERARRRADIILARKCDQVKIFKAEERHILNHNMQMRTNNLEGDKIMYGAH